MELQEYVEKLKALEVYDQFANNLKAMGSLTVEEYFMTFKEFMDGSFWSFLSWAFPWYFTTEGHDFWSNIANS